MYMFFQVLFHRWIELTAGVDYFGDFPDGKPGNE